MGMRKADYMLLYYLRHADPIYSPDSLTPQGIRQAEALAHRLSGCDLDRIYCSSSNRAKLTAQPTADIIGKEIKILDWCNESYAWKDLTVRRDDGFLTWCFFHKPIVELFQSNEVRKLGMQWYNHPTFKDTRFKEGYLRIERETYAFLESLGYKHDVEKNAYIPIAPTNERVALFAHAGFGLAFLSVLLDIPYPMVTTKMDIQHSGMTVINFEEKEGIVVPKMLQLSNDSHLYRDGLPTKYNNQIKI